MKPLGQGANGVVYLAVNNKTGGLFAIKTSIRVHELSYADPESVYIWNSLNFI